jgi:tRNA(Ile)-lysidine synthase
LSPLLRRIARTIRTRALFSGGDRVAVAVSGGADSVALAWALDELAARGAWTVAGVIHVHHGLRGREADAAAEAVTTLARRLGLPCDVRYVDVPALMRRERRSLEAAARHARYEALALAAEALDATAVATGHTQDDQAETVLLRLFRGAGSRGLSAIRPRRGMFVRPLIDCRRADLEAELRARGEPWHDDHSNHDVSIPRNYLRHQVLPSILERWPGAVAALARFAEIAAGDEQFLTNTAAQVQTAVTLSAPAGVQVLDVRGLRELPPPIARRLIRAAIEAEDATPTFRDIEAVRRMVSADKPVGHLDLARVTVERQGAALRFRGPTLSRGPARPFQYELPIPGRVHISETGGVIQASLHRGGGHSLGEGHAASPEHGGTSLRTFGDGQHRAVVQASALSLPLMVRNRRRGDRLRPFGAPGRRKLQDLLVDRKIRREARDEVPLVVDAAGRIVWVAGVTIAEEYRVSSPETGVVILDFKKGNQ